MLKKSFGLWKEKKAKSFVYLNWKKWWLKENIESSDRDARKKRELVKIIEHFPRLQSVSNFLSEFHGLKNDT